MRVSLTGDPVDEIRVAYDILKSLGLRKRGINFVSCPTCGRCQIDLIPVAEEVEKRLAGVESNITVAVMGCAVNGPGEAREADFGIAGGRGEGLLFKNGEIIRKVGEGELADALVEEVLKAAKEKEA
jgi:(E)-4-hydroxy-3-methylbut-2-enyl-diphosphate synthase